MKLRYVFFCLMLIGLWGCESDSSTDNNTPETNGTKAPEQPSEPTYNIKWTVPNDYSFTQKTKQGYQITYNPGTDQEDIAKLSMTSNRKFNIGKVDKEGAFAVTMTYLGVMGEYKGPDGKWAYDSNGSQKGQPASGLEKMVGTQVQFRLDPNSGQVVEVFSSEDLENVLAMEDINLDAPEKVAREVLQPEWYVFPDGPVKLEQEWTREIKLKYQYQIALNMTFKIASRENGQAKIIYSATVNPLEQKDMVMLKSKKGETFYHELNGSVSGEIMVDEPSGAFISHMTTSTMEGDRIFLDKNGLEKSRLPMKVEMEINSEYAKN